uniref:Uncharacterized protein n=1 Tax=Acrobeloides nanus TaxID=290746 RepID=A0A914CHM2_9BILA
MGQQPSSFVVEIATPRYGKFQSLPQKDPEEEDAQWRITVNPAAELAANEQLRSLISRLNHVQKHFAPSDARQILAALHYLDISQDLMLPLLTVISNATAFTANQVLKTSASEMSS